MKTIGIVAEFNPLHNGHKYLIDTCKAKLSADRCIVVMSSDFVQRGAPAILDKFTRAKTALLSGADVVIELPVYYSLGSAEFFAQAAISILSSIGVVDYLCFGSESDDLDKIEQIANVLNHEPAGFKSALSSHLKNGDSFALARSKALSEELMDILNTEDIKDYTDIFSSPNGILAIEYVKTLNMLKSNIRPFALKRIGATYHSDVLGDIPSSSGIRARVLSSSVSKDKTAHILEGTMPAEALRQIAISEGHFMSSNDFSSLLLYKLIIEKQGGYTKYLDVNSDISNLIVKNLYDFEDISSFCSQLKSKNLAHTRISRCLFHILLDITQKNMDEYKADNFTSYARMLAFKRSSSDIIAKMHERSSIPVIDRLKDADNILSPLQKRLFEETLASSQIYNQLYNNKIISEYSLKPVIL